MKPATESRYRVESRRIIHQVIEDNVHGPVQTLLHHDILELRAKLREAYPYGEKRFYPYRIWCEEVRHALGFEVRKPKRYHKPRLIPRHKVMPCMREWALNKGILAALMLLFVLTLNGCSSRNTCNGGGAHKWGKWQQTGSHNIDGIRLLQRECSECGMIEVGPAKTSW